MNNKLVLFPLFQAGPRATQIHAKKDDDDEEVEGEHDPVDGLRDEAPAGRIDHLLVARHVVGAGNVHGLHVDSVTARRGKLGGVREGQITRSVVYIGQAISTISEL